MLPGTKLYAPSGDTTGAADLTAIQSAMNQLGTAGGGTVFLSPGTYYVAGTITIPKNVGIEGIGDLATSNEDGSCVVINHIPASATSSLFVNYTVASGYGYIGPIRGLHCIAGNANAVRGVYLTSIAEFRIERCAFVAYTVGVRCSYTLCSVLDQVYSEGDYLGGNFGLEILAGSGQSTTVLMRDCRFRRHEYCIMVNDNACHSLWVDNCIFESCRSGIARLQDGHTVIRNAYVEAMNGTSGSTELVVATDGAEYELTIVNSTDTAYQSAPAEITDGDTAITVANLKTKLLTMASSTSGRAPTVPTGTAIYGTEANPGIAIGHSIDWTFINTGNQTVTITQAAGHTLVGGMALTAGTQGLFRTRCTAANTAITYRLA